jgi:uncharacterized membrane protein YeaQ/YmgE (transglycosylase-associated protein family)
MIWALVIGLIVGAVAKMLMPGRDPGGIIVTMLIGVVGAMLAQWIGLTVGWYQQNEAPGFIAAVVGSMLLLWAYRAIVGRSTRTI